MENNPCTVIADNIDRLRERMARAAERAGRHPDAIRLVAVTKYVGPEQIAAVIAAGCRDLGESRPQQLWARQTAFSGAGVTWHLIGPLQRNKVERTVPLVGLLHTLDSRRLADAIDNARVNGPPVQALLEVNISGDVGKHGVPPEEAERVLGELSASRGVSIRGLMGMASREGGAARARTEFARLRELRERLRRNCPAGVSLEELSMGMSGDFEEAIAEGATLVRIGSLLFEGLSTGLLLPTRG